MDWTDVFLEQERQAHLNFFGREFDLSAFKKTLQKHGEKKVKEWKKLLLEPHFLPKVKMDRKAEFTGWKVRPDNHAYEVVYQGKVLRNIDGKIIPDKKAHWLSGEIVLVDTRLKPDYRDGKQMWEGDENFLGPILEGLRESGQINKYEYGKQYSRFGVSADDWENHIKLALLKDERFNHIQWRLERAVEGNVIPQMYPYTERKCDGNTSTWIWYEEYFEDCSFRLDGGHSDYGGLSDFYWYWSGSRWYFGSFRPLAVL
ncbi:MAG: hypothetical protein AAB556_01055 [Patescibacteria group bacterium]